MIDGRPLVGETGYQERRICDVGNGRSWPNGDESDAPDMLPNTGH